MDLIYELLAIAMIAIGIFCVGLGTWELILVNRAQKCDNSIAIPARQKLRREDRIWYETWKDDVACARTQGWFGCIFGSAVVLFVWLVVIPHEPLVNLQYFFNKPEPPRVLFHCDTSPTADPNGSIWTTPADPSPNF